MICLVPFLKKPLEIYPKQGGQSGARSTEHCERFIGIPSETGNQNCWQIMDGLLEHALHQNPSNIGPTLNEHGGTHPTDDGIQRNEMETIKQNKRMFKNSSPHNAIINTCHRSCRVEPFESFRWNVSSRRRSCLFDFREQTSEASLFRWINFVNQPAKLIDRERFARMVRGFSREREKPYSIVQFRSFCGCVIWFSICFLFGPIPIGPLGKPDPCTDVREEAVRDRER